MTKSQFYGVAVHSALKDFFDKLKNGKTNKKFLLSRFLFHLKRQPLSENDFQEVKKKGMSALGGYYDFYCRKWQKNVINELSINGVFLEEDIRLTGKIDKLEIIGDLGKTRVVDYKTGKPKSRLEIEGLSKNSAGDIKRQLVFYKLLLDRYKNNCYQMAEGTVDFIEPDRKNNYKQEVFNVLPEETEELIKAIKKTAKEILGLDFWDKRCDDKNCRFCGLRQAMKQ